MRNYDVVYFYSLNKISFTKIVVIKIENRICNKLVKLIGKMYSELKKEKYKITAFGFYFLKTIINNCFNVNRFKIHLFLLRNFLSFFTKLKVKYI